MISTRMMIPMMMMKRMRRTMNFKHLNLKHPPPPHHHLVYRQSGLV